MTDQQHPITPPPELVRQWMAEIWHGATPVQVADDNHHIAIQAARWAADLELEACCEYIWRWFGNPQPYIASLRAARRPKPPSLKERALQAWAAVVSGTDDQTAMAVIRRALEQLDD